MDERQATVDGGYRPRDETEELDLEEGKGSLPIFLAGDPF